MIRREFLKLLGLAPIAAPMAAKAIAAQPHFAGGGFVSVLGVDGGGILGEMQSGESLLPASWGRADLAGAKIWPRFSIAAPVAEQSIEQQMAEHDLFDDVSSIARGDR